MKMLCFVLPPEVSARVYVVSTFAPPSSVCFVKPGVFNPGMAKPRNVITEKIPVNLEVDVEYCNTVSTTEAT
jgi:hypothetical protein